MPIKNELSAVQSEKLAIESAILLGSPSSLEKAVNLANNAKLLSSPDKMAYSWVAYEMARLVYPELAGNMPPGNISPPESKIVNAFIDARNGKILEPSSESGPLLELLPSLAIFRVKKQEQVQNCLSAVERFKQFGLDSAVADLVVGLAYEQSRDIHTALASYTKAIKIAPDCYPAIIGQARMYLELGNGEEALNSINRLDTAITIHAGRRVKAQALYTLGKYSEAMPLITEVLRDDPLDSFFMLLRAHILILEGEYKLALPLLDAYASVNSGDKLYILLRARIAVDSAKDRNAAIMALRKGLLRYPDDIELMVAISELLWGGDSAEKKEAVDFAKKIVQKKPDSVIALKILLYFYIETNNYTDAVSLADSIISLGYKFDDKQALFLAYRGSGRYNDAATLARRWHNEEPKSEDALLAFLIILIESGEKATAQGLITKALTEKGTSAFRSNLYLLQSKIQNNSDTILNSLRSALVENGMNIDALAAMTDFYIKKLDYQRAKFYLKQALALMPNRPDLIERRNTLAQLGVNIP